MVVVGTTFLSIVERVDHVARVVDGIEREDVVSRSRPTCIDRSTGCSSRSGPRGTPAPASRTGEPPRCGMPPESWAGPSSAAPPPPVMT